MVVVVVVWERGGHNHLGRDGRADGEEEAVAEGAQREHLAHRHREADRGGEEEAHLARRGEGGTPL